DERDLPRAVARARFEEAEGGRVRRAAGLDREAVVVQRIVRRGVHREAARRSVLEPLIDGEDDQAPGACQLTGVQQPGKVGQRAGVVAAVPAQDLSDALGYVTFAPGKGFDGFVIAESTFPACPRLKVCRGAAEMPPW